MKVTTDLNCSIRYLLFNVLFVNAEEMAKDNYYVSGGYHLIFNQDHTISTFGYGIKKYDETSVIIGVNGFAAAINRTIGWNTAVDTNGLGLTLDKQ